MYSISVLPLDDEGLLEVRVTAEESESIRTQPLTFTLVRWMLDPTLVPEEPLTDEYGEILPTDGSGTGDVSGAGGGDAP